MPKLLVLMVVLLVALPELPVAVPLVVLRVVPLLVPVDLLVPEVEVPPPEAGGRTCAKPSHGTITKREVTAAP